MAKFQKGHKFAKGGVRPNSGRKPDWFRERMRKIATHKEAIKFIEDTVLGKEVDEFIVPQTGEAIAVRAKAETRYKVWADTADRGFGRATQSVEHLGDIGLNFSELIKRAEEERKLK